MLTGAESSACRRLLGAYEYLPCSESLLPPCRSVTLASVTDDWPRLGQAVRARRENMSMTQTEAVRRAEGSVSISVWRAIEKAFRPPYARASLLAVCRVLRWDPESIDLVLQGGDPIELPVSLVDEGADLAAQVAELRRQVARHEEILERMDAERRADQAEARYRARLNQLAERTTSPQPAEGASPQRERRGA